MPFPLDAARFPPPSRGGGRAQTAAPSGLVEKVPRFSGNSVTGIAHQPLPPNRAQMPLHALCGKKIVPSFCCFKKRPKKLPHPKNCLPAS